MATAKDMRAMNVEELDKLAASTREEIFRLRIKHKTGRLESSADLSKKRRELAQVLTVLTEKKKAANA